MKWSQRVQFTFPKFILNTKQLSLFRSSYHIHYNIKNNCCSDLSPSGYLIKHATVINKQFISSVLDVFSISVSSPFSRSDGSHSEGIYCKKYWYYVWLSFHSFRRPMYPIEDSWKAPCFKFLRNAAARIVFYLVFPPNAWSFFILWLKAC